MYSQIREHETQLPNASRVLVLGGAGFIGRHTVDALLEKGASIVIGSRRPGRAAKRLSPAARSLERRRVRMERLLRPQDWDSILLGIDVVVNCVGILRQNGHASYERVHHLSPAALAQACWRSGIRLVHVSALGLTHPVRSRFLTSKRDGELAIMESGGDWHIVRPSLLDGEFGFGARWLRRAANWPLYPLPASACGRLAPLDVRDVGLALAVLALCDEPVGLERRARIIELGGESVRTLGEHLTAMRTRSRPDPIPIWSVPSVLARAVSHVCDLFHVTPYSFGHYELLRHDNIPHRNALPALLGRAPRVVCGVGHPRTKEGAYPSGHVAAS